MAILELKPANGRILFLLTVEPRGNFAVTLDAAFFLFGSFALFECSLEFLKDLGPVEQGEPVVTWQAPPIFLDEVKKNSSFSVRIFLIEGFEKLACAPPIIYTFRRAWDPYGSFGFLRGFFMGVIMSFLMVFLRKFHRGLVRVPQGSLEDSLGFLCVP